MIATLESFHADSCNGLGHVIWSDLFFDRLLLDFLAFNWTNTYSRSSHMFALRYFWSGVLLVDKESL
jgi:hypothetical protein